jgi:hypothetical protein
MNSKEEISSDFCLNFVQEFSLRIGVEIYAGLYNGTTTMYLQ